jgi:hypothetical protein
MEPRIADAVAAYTADRCLTLIVGCEGAVRRSSGNGCALAERVVGAACAGSEMRQATNEEAIIARYGKLRDCIVMEAIVFRPVPTLQFFFLGADVRRMSRSGQTRNILR